MPGYQRSWLRLDVIAGLTVCAILVPEGMAYAELAGMPPETAFYAAPIALLAYAVLGSSRQLVVAVSSAIAIMSAATISGLAAAGSVEYAALTAALAILAGLVSIAAGFLKLGRIAQFFSESVLLGFVFGLALLITIKQIPKLLGIEAHGESALDLVRDMIPHLRETDLLTLAVGLAGIAGMIVLERRLPRVPAALVVLLASIAVSVALGLEARGVHVVGELPAGLRGPTLPGVGLEALPLLLLGAVGIALVAFAEAIGPANEFAREHGGKIDPNRELIAIGAANTGAGLFTGFPIGSSLSKSAANDRAGARTPASLVTAAAATALVALFLTPLFEPLPEATLGAIVIVAVLGHDEGRQDAPAVGAAADRLLARDDRAGRGPRHADPGGARDRRRRLAGRPGLARERGAPDVPGPGERRPGAGGPAERAGRGDPGAAHRAPRRDALLRQRGLGARRDPRGRRGHASRAPRSSCWTCRSRRRSTSRWSRRWRTCTSDWPPTGSSCG